MTTVGQVAAKVRSKNAGPFWLTIDIFCGTQQAYDLVSVGLQTAAVAQVLKTNAQALKRFDIADLHVVKFSLPRPAVQGAQSDRDMHGASFGALIAEMEI